ncbi:hypothetical protein M5C90_24815 [Pseudomonas chlororaphis subsp. piscium]|nr:hypothetical protein M5C90_24815 [Pseudomonas chlororaphis subsp. piscium]
MKNDPWQPTTEPARTLYEAFQAEAAKRAGRAVEQWLASERDAVWKAARDYAQQHGLQVPTLEAVQRAEQSACGHVDYGAQWAYGVARAIRGPKPPHGRRRT